MPWSSSALPIPGSPGSAGSAGRLVRPVERDGIEGGAVEGVRVEGSVVAKEHKDHVGKELETHVNPLAGPASGQQSEHFIPADQRPDLADSALRNEDPETGPGRG
ncbi:MULTISPECIES: hypothetical protein [unclassified Kitasatospora]|uniref:hypothetical protein n=1 Tax=unclassified Kitasatospora TaxID=2633591 RepID=UPI0033C9E13B